MTKEQQLATRDLERAQKQWLHAYGWTQYQGRWTHPKLEQHAPLHASGVTTFDAMAFTRSAPLTFGGF